MNSEQLTKHFKSLGARVKFHPIDTPRPRATRPPETTYIIDVRTDKQGEYFDIAQGKNAPEFELLQIKPKSRHMLLYTHHGQRFLFGHDERHWFVAGIRDAVSTIRAAKQSLLPREIWEQVRHLSPDEVDNRRNAFFLRQGEWFFVPSNKEIPERMIHRNEPLQRTPRSKPHICQELYREGGELVYLVGNQQYSEQEYQEQKKRNPEFDQGRSVQTRIRNPRVYVRGYVKHDDHATLTLTKWHRVFINSEFTTSSVAFLD
jgi:hypothetical protein